MAVVAPAIQAAGRRDALRRAVLKTLIYADLFDFPLTAEELTTYLLDIGASAGEVVEAALEDPDVVQVGGFFCLRGRQHLAQERLRRRPISRRLWRRARTYGRLLAAIPFVRLVAVTGSLAPGNAREADDIDLLLVVAPGRLWLTRLAALVVVRLARLAGDELCPNFLLAETRLTIDGAAFPAYYARELAQMSPLFGRDAYRALRLANGWMARVLPNANHVERAHLPNDLPGLPGRAKLVAEGLLAARVFDVLERAERRRKIRKLRGRHAREAGVVELSADRCRGHFGRYVERMMAVFELRCAAIDARQPVR